MSTDSGKLASRKVKLEYQEHLYSTVIQTDRAIHKPGDLVHFRAILLDRYLRPAKISSPIKIYVSDATKTGDQLFDNVAFNSSVFTGEYQLAKILKLGQWHISVYVGSSLLKEKTFEVGEYVLPTFSVHVETEGDIMINQLAKFVIKAHYTYGKPVQGFVTLYLKTNGNKPAKFMQKMKLTKEPLSMTVDLIKELKFTQESTETELNVTAVVEEKFTGIKQNYTTTVKLHSNTFAIEKHCDVPSSFLPNKLMKIKVKIKITNFRRIPITDRKNQAVLTASNVEDHGKSLTFTASVVKGVATFEVTSPDAVDYTLEVSYFQAKGSFELPTFEDGSGDFELDVHSKSYEVDNHIDLTLKRKPFVTPI